MTDIVREALDALEKWPLVQGAVAILVLVIAALLAWATLRKQLPPPGGAAPSLPPPASVPIQVESPWMVQHLVEMHLDIEGIKSVQAAQEVHLRVIGTKIDGIASLLKRRQSRRERSGKS